MATGLIHTPLVDQPVTHVKIIILNKQYTGVPCNYIGSTPITVSKCLNFMSSMPTHASIRIQ